MIIISAVATLFIASAFYENPTLTTSKPQDDPKLASIKEGISKTTPQGNQIIEKVLRMKLEINGELTNQTLGEIIEIKKTHGITLIGWEASAMKLGRWRIILLYHERYRKQYYEEAQWEYNPKTGKLHIVEANNSILPTRISFSKSYKFKGRMVKLVKQYTDVTYERTPSKLYTIIGSRKYFIDHIRGNGASTLPEEIIDSTGMYISYPSGTGCEYEGEGTATFISDIYGKRKVPIVASCLRTGPKKFLEYKGRLYLLIGEGSGGTSEENGFWLYDISAKEFVIHAKGEITEIRKGVFSYHYYTEIEKIKPVGTVTMKNLVNRASPLKLLQRYPTHGLTRRKNTRIFPDDGGVACFHEEDKYEVIPKAGTKVLILEKCPEGEYEVYYKGKMAKMRKGDLKPIK